MSTLFHIAAQYRADLALLADLDLDPQTVADTLEGMQGELQDKLRAVIAYSLDLDVLATGTEEAAKRMGELAKSRRARVQALRDYALTTMQGCGIGEVSTDEFAAKLAKKPASVNVLDASLIPAVLMRTPEPVSVPDKASIAAVLKAGGVVPGCELVQGYRLAIK